MNVVEVAENFTAYQSLCSLVSSSSVTYACPTKELWRQGDVKNYSELDVDSAYLLSAASATDVFMKPLYESLLYRYDTCYIGYGNGLFY
jgi:hypothetical protein